MDILYDRYYTLTGTSGKVIATFNDGDYSPDEINNMAQEAIDRGEEFVEQKEVCKHFDEEGYWECEELIQSW